VDRTSLLRSRASRRHSASQTPLQRATRARRCDCHPAELSHPAVAMSPFRHNRPGSLISSRSDWSAAGTTEVRLLNEGTDRRLIEMRPCASFRDLRRFAAPSPSDRAPGVAICSSRLDGSRTLQSTATIAVCRNCRFERHLRPMTPPIVAVRFCTNRSKALWELALRRTTKKVSGFSALPHPQPLVFQGKPRGSGAPKLRGSCNKTTLNRQSRAVAPRGLNRGRIDYRGSFIRTPFEEPGP
jgi:hypothetical protein